MNDPDLVIGLIGLFVFIAFAFGTGFALGRLTKKG